MKEIKKIWLPIIVSFAALCAVILLTTPMLKAAPRNIPLAVLSLDEGAKTPNGELNMGNKLLEKLTVQPATSDEDAAIKWETFTSELELQDAINNNEVYAAVVIPKDYTASQMAVQADPSAPLKNIDLTINQGKNPTVASTVQAIFTQIGTSTGLTFETKYVNALPEDMSSGTLSTIISTLIYLPSLVTSIAIALMRRPNYKVRKGRVRAIGIQLAYSLGLSFLIGLGTAFAASTIGGVTIPFANLVLFVAIASFAFQTIILSAMDWLGTAGASVYVLLLVFGMPIISLPYEFLPSFWQSFIYPWIPQRFIAEGVRQVLFMNESFWNSSSLGLIIIGLVGMTCLFATLAKRIKLTNNVDEQ